VSEAEEVKVRQWKKTPTIITCLEMGEREDKEYKKLSKGRETDFL
jgi:hypothetical protein